jgi:hypothetical protein
MTFSYKIGKMSAMETPKKKGKSVNNDDVKSEGGQNNGGGAPASGPTRQQ